VIASPSTARAVWACRVATIRAAGERSCGRGPSPFLTTLRGLLSFARDLWATGPQCSRAERGVMSLSLIPAAPPIKCDARRSFAHAEGALAYDQYIEAGCFLREGVRQMLTALCEYHGAPLSKRRSRRTVGALLESLWRLKTIDSDDMQMLLNVTDVGNRAAHCNFVMRRELDDAISEASWYLKLSPLAGGAA
jgi:hypothetical protein